MQLLSKRPAPPAAPRPVLPGDDPRVVQLAETPPTRWVARVGLWSVLKVSVAFYVVVGMALVTAAVVLCVVSDTTGLTPHLQHLARSLFSVKSLPLHPADVAAVTAAAGGVIALTGTILNFVAALVYNLIADLIGGIGVKAQSLAAE